jgi:hypothetical protein
MMNLESLARAPLLLQERGRILEERNANTAPLTTETITECQLRSRQQLYTTISSFDK